MTLRPHDLLVLLSIVAREQGTFGTFADLSRQTGVSLGEVHKSLQRSDAAGLYRDATREVVQPSLFEFLSAGVRYAFPAIAGHIGRGVPTGVAASPLSDLFDGDALTPLLTPVWPSPTGTRKGYAIDPLYKTVPDVAPREPALYELLSLTDAVREGKARERSCALDALADRIIHRPASNAVS